MKSHTIRSERTCIRICICICTCECVYTHVYASNSLEKPKHSNNPYLVQQSPLRRPRRGSASADFRPSCAQAQGML